jgi:hypothetical protein
VKWKPVSPAKTDQTGRCTGRCPSSPVPDAFRSMFTAGELSVAHCGVVSKLFLPTLSVNPARRAAG